MRVLREAGRSSSRFGNSVSKSCVQTTPQGAKKREDDERIGVRNNKKREENGRSRVGDPVFQDPFPFRYRTGLILPGGRLLTASECRDAAMVSRRLISVFSLFSCLVSAAATERTPLADPANDGRESESVCSERGEVHRKGRNRVPRRR